MSDTAIIDGWIAAEQAKAPFGAGLEPGEQRSVEWLMARVGHCTASRFKDVLDRLKSGAAGAKRTAYLWELVIERLSERPAQHYESAAMQHGTQNEALARMAYEARTGAIVTETGFRKHPQMAYVGCSPDGLIEPDGGIEIKCPFNSAHHLACFLDRMPAEHMAQIQGAMWIVGAQWWDFVSFDPRMPAPLQLYIERIARNEAFIERLYVEVIVFLVEVDELLAKVKAMAA